MTSTEFQVVVIGCGVAGLAAAAEIAKGGASVIAIEREPLPGGLVANVGRLDDWPGDKPVAGSEIAEALANSARSAGATLAQAEVTAVRKRGERFDVVAAGTPYECDAVLVAVGGRLRRLDVPGERELAGRGVSQCDWCDGGLYRGKAVAVVGGGDAALQAALHLATICSTVTLVVRGSQLRARRDYALRAADTPNIAFAWDTRVARFIGEGALERLSLVSDYGDAPADLRVDGAFVFAGIVPDSSFLEFDVAMRDGMLVADDEGRTSVEGVFAAGAVRRAGAVTTAIGDGVVAGRGVIRHLKAREIL